MPGSANPRVSSCFGPSVLRVQPSSSGRAAPVWTGPSLGPGRTHAVSECPGQTLMGHSLYLQALGKSLDSRISLALNPRSATDQPRDPGQIPQCRQASSEQAVVKIVTFLGRLLNVCLAHSLCVFSECLLLWPWLLRGRKLVTPLYLKPPKLGANVLETTANWCPTPHEFLHFLA